MKRMTISFLLFSSVLFADDPATIPGDVKAAAKKVFKQQDFEKCDWSSAEAEYKVTCRLTAAEYPELSVTIKQPGLKARGLIVYREAALQMPEVKTLYEKAIEEFRKSGLSETEPQIISAVYTPNGALEYYYVAQMGGMNIEFDAKKKPRSKVREGR